MSVSCPVRPSGPEVLCVFKVQPPGHPKSAQGTNSCQEHATYAHSGSSAIHADKTDRISDEEFSVPVLRVTCGTMNRLSRKSREQDISFSFRDRLLDNSAMVTYAPNSTC